MATSLPNGTGPSPPPIVTSVKGYPLSFVIQGNSGTKAGTAAVANQAPVSFAKGHSLVFNNMGMAQMQQQSAHIIAQQPTSPLQQQPVQQKGKHSKYFCLLFRCLLNFVSKYIFYTELSIIFLNQLGSCSKKIRVCVP